MTASRRVAHTATFLQTFHTGVTTADRRAAVGAEGSEPSAPAAPESAALAFVRGQAATFAQSARTSGYTADYEGVTVTHGDGLLSEAQAKYVVSIALNREGVTDAMMESLKVRLLQGFAKHAASEFITKYKDLPRKAVQANAPKASASTEVPAGRYAIATEDGVKFYRLDRPTEGRWAGYVFLKVQASDELYPIRNHAARDAVLAEIAKDVNGSATAYGQLLGKCYACGRTLTDETSRALGIGPDCRSK